jgi:hypothetical protein
VVNKTQSTISPLVENLALGEIDATMLTLGFLKSCIV